MRRSTIAYDPMGHKCFRHLQCGDGFQRNHSRKFGEPVGSYKEVQVSGCGAMKWPEDVDCYGFERILGREEFQGFLMCAEFDSFL